MDVIILITKQQLWQTIHDAQKEQAIGILIWVDTGTYEKGIPEMTADYEVYRRITAKLQEGEAKLVGYATFESPIVEFLAIPTEEVASNDKFFDRIIYNVEVFGLNGPIVLLPSNRLLNINSS